MSKGKEERINEGQEENCISNPSSHDDQVEKTEISGGDVMVQETPHQGHHNSLFSALVSVTRSHSQGISISKMLPRRMENHPKDNEDLESNENKASSSMTAYRGNVIKPATMLTPMVHPRNFSSWGHQPDSEEDWEDFCSEEEESYYAAPSSYPNRPGIVSRARFESTGSENSASVTSQHGNVMNPVAMPIVQSSTSSFDYLWRHQHDSEGEDQGDSSCSEDEDESPDEETSSVSSAMSEHSLNMSYEELPTEQNSAMPIFQSFPHVAPHPDVNARFMCMECGNSLRCVLVLACEHLIYCDNCAGAILHRMTHCPIIGCGAPIRAFISCSSIWLLSCNHLIYAHGRGASAILQQLRRCPFPRCDVTIRAFRTSSIGI